MSTVQKLIQSIENSQGDVFQAVNATYDMLEELTNGEVVVVDTTAPFPYALQVSAAAAMASMNAMASHTRPLYPRLTSTFGELYHHISEGEIDARFAQPIREHNVLMFMSVQEVQDAAVLNPASQTKRLIIPGDFEIKIKGIPFTCHYPLVIDILNDNEYQAYLDSTNSKGFPSLTSNNVNLFKTTIADVDMIALEIPLDQLLLTTDVYSINRSVGFSKKIGFVDEFHRARAFYKQNGEWTEMHISHSDLSYGPEKPTLVVSVEENYMQVDLPQIYLTKNLVEETIRIDVYSTRGELNESVRDLTSESYEYQNGVTERSGPFSKNIGLLTTFLFASEEDLRGGRKPLTFDEFKERVVYGLMGKESAVLLQERRKVLGDRGYILDVIRDTALGTTHLATRALPTVPQREISIGVNQAVFNIDTLKDKQSLSIGRGKGRDILKPEAIFINDGKGVRLLSDDELTELNGLDSEQLSLRSQQNDYFFNPFFIILDSSNSTFNTRVYQLDKPSIKSRQFIDINPSIGFTLTTRRTEIVRNDKGFELKVYAVGVEDPTDVYLQLIFNSRINGERWFSSVGVPQKVGEELVFSFPIESSFDINNENEIEITNLVDENNSPIPAFLLLENVADLVYVMEGNNRISSSLDSTLSQRMHSRPVSGISHEKIRINFGRQLKSYYSEGRPVLTPPEYKRYDSDIPRRYEKDVYESDADGVIFRPDEAEKIKLLHSAGDVVLDSNGDPEILHAKGSVEYNAEGKPIILKPETIIREIRIPLYEAIFRFADVTTIKEYTDNLPALLESYSENEVGADKEQMLERTELFFTPSSSLGLSEVRLSDQTIVRHDTNLSFKISLTLRSETYQTDGIENQLRELIRSALVKVLRKRELSRLSIYQAINEVLPTGVVGLDLEVDLPKGDFMQLINGNDNFSIKTQLKVLSNGQLDIGDSIQFAFFENKQ